MRDGMTYRRVISPVLMRRQQNTTICTKRENDGAVNKITAHHILASLVFTILVTYSKELFNDNKPFSPINVFVIVVSVLTLVITLSRRKPKRKDMEAIVLYPLGIQLGTITLDVSCSNSANIKVTPQVFLHRETIIDCVVTELVYSHKVQSTVILRTKQHHSECKNVNPKPAFTEYETTAEDDDITKTLTRTRETRESINNLIQLFSDFEMTYVECLAIRSQINNYLKLNDELITIRQSTIS